jgi:hypothetical protein
MANNSTKVRPLAHATTSTSAHSRHADGNDDFGCCDERIATADLSDSKHEDFAASSDTPTHRHALSQFELTIFYGTCSIC